MPHPLARALEAIPAWPRAAAAGLLRHRRELEGFTADGDDRVRVLLRLAELSLATGAVGEAIAAARFLSRNADLDMALTRRLDTVRARLAVRNETTTVQATPARPAEPLARMRGSLVYAESAATRGNLADALRGFRDVAAEEPCGPEGDEFRYLALFAVGGSCVARGQAAAALPLFSLASGLARAAGSTEGHAITEAWRWSAAVACGDSKAEAETVGCGAVPTVLIDAAREWSSGDPDAALGLFADGMAASARATDPDEHAMLALGYAQALDAFDEPFRAYRVLRLAYRDLDQWFQLEHALVLGVAVQRAQTSLGPDATAEFDAQLASELVEYDDE